MTIRSPPPSVEASGRPRQGFYPTAQPEEVDSSTMPTRGKMTPEASSLSALSQARFPPAVHPHRSTASAPNLHHQLTSASAWTPLHRRPRRLPSTPRTRRLHTTGHFHMPHCLRRRSHIHAPSRHPACRDIHAPSRPPRCRAPTRRAPPHRQPACFHASTPPPPRTPSLRRLHPHRHAAASFPAPSSRSGDARGRSLRRHRLHPWPIPRGAWSGHNGCSYYRDNGSLQ